MLQSVHHQPCSQQKIAFVDQQVYWFRMACNTAAEPRLLQTMSWQSSVLSAAGFDRGGCVADLLQYSISLRFDYFSKPL